MKNLISFKNDDSGAVTVDWVVLTAAIVGIAIAVIVLISGGVESASEGINDELQTAGTGWRFTDPNSTTLSEYVDDFMNYRNDSGKFNDPETLVAGIDLEMQNNAPNGYSFNGSLIDTNSGTPIYYNSTDDLYSVNNTVYTADEYSNAANGYTVYDDDGITPVSFVDPTISEGGLAEQFPPQEA